MVQVVLFFVVFIISQCPTVPPTPSLSRPNIDKRVFDKLKANGSIYALTEPDLDIVAGGLNDAIELIEDNLTDDLAEEENEEILGYKNDCQRLVDLLAS